MKNISVRDRQLESTRGATYALSLLLLLGQLARAKKMKTKTCNRCKEVKSVVYFSKQSRSKDGLKGYCKTCANLANKETYARNNGVKIPYKRESLNVKTPKHMKYCPSCKKSFSKDRFSVSLSTKSKLHSCCRTCSAKRASDYRVKQKENMPLIQRHKANMSSMFHSYAIQEKQFQEMMNVQKGICAICNIDFGDLPIRAALDHCHATGKVRGLLCKDCNTLLGKIEAEPHLLHNVNIYLNKE